MSVIQRLLYFQARFLLTLLSATASCCEARTAPLSAKFLPQEKQEKLVSEVTYKRVVSLEVFTIDAKGELNKLESASWPDYVLDLSQDDPLYSELVQFPPPNVVESMINLSSEHIKHLDAKIRESNFDKWRLSELTAAKTEALECIGPYLLLKQIQNRGKLVYFDKMNTEKRRGLLKEMRHIVGTKRFMSGDLGPCVPIWRFNHID